MKAFDIGQFAARELTNDFLAILSMFAALLLFLYLVDEWRKGFIYDTTNKLALAWAAICFGLFVSRLWTVVLLYATRKHLTEIQELTESLYLVPMLGTILSGIGFLCMMRIFERTEWKGRYWKTALICTIVFTILVLL